MDKFFHKVLVERERSGARCSLDGTSRHDRSLMARDDYAYPVFESTRRTRRKTKYLAEHLGPLRRYLKGCVGRNWNAVRAEIKAALPGMDPVRRHIWQHIEHYVAVNVVKVDGRWVHAERRAWRVTREYFVCPRSGMLRVTPMERDERLPNPHWVLTTEWTGFLWTRGVWWEVTLERVPVRRGAWFFDRLLQQTFVVGDDADRELTRWYGRADRYVLAARELTREQARSRNLLRAK